MVAPGLPEVSDSSGNFSGTRQAGPKAEIDLDTSFTNFLRDSKGKPIFIELCSGCGILSATAKAAGYQVMPVDCDRNRHSTKVQTLSLDLTTEYAWNLLHFIVCECDVVAVHVAPPCGTCSRAREIRMSDRSHGPPQLRSMTHPYGVPYMSNRNRVKVEAANALYRNMSIFLEFLTDKLVPWTVENPTNSWLWQLPCMENLVSRMHFVHFHNCAYGGLRFKKTSFLTNCEVFGCLAKLCDGGHQRLPWSYDDTAQQFDTALEAEYPVALCQAYVRVLLQISDDSGVPISQYDTMTNQMRPHKQPAGRKVAPLIPEYFKTVTVTLPGDPPLDGKRCLSKPVRDIPMGSKLLRSEANKGTNNQYTLCVFGIFHTPEQFVKISRTLSHPYDELRHLPDLLTTAIFNMLTNSKLDNAKHRLNTLKLWRQWATDLHEDEVALRANLDPNVAAVLDGKPLLLLEKLANEVLGWPDKSVHQEMRDGFRIVGKVQATGVFRQQPKIGNLSENEFKDCAKFLRPALIGKAKSNMNAPHAQELYDITFAEATEKRWLEGPLTQNEVDDKMGHGWMPVRRFCVEQGSKLRPIDDFCENRLNQTFSSVGEITLKTMDHVTWAVLILCKHSLHEGGMSFRLSTGEFFTGEVHDDWKHGATFKATTIDLKAAYKQLPLHPEDKNKGVVTLANPCNGNVQFFLMNTLPFGAAASVLHFNHISALLWALGCQLGLIWSAYYDDYPLICPGGMEASTLGGAKALLGLLGFKYSADKLVQPDFQADMLGVRLDLGACGKGVVQVSNKPGRIDEILQTLTTIVEERKLRPSDLPSQLGRLQFADMQIAGRSGRLAMHDLRGKGTTNTSMVDIDDSEIEALGFLCDRLRHGRPRTLTAGIAKHPILVYTDGALEYDDEGRGQGTIGGVLVHPDGWVRAFGCKVPENIMQSWTKDGKVHVIGLVELYAAVVALCSWYPLFEDRRVILFVDNYSAQDCLIKGSAKNREWRNLLLILEGIDDNLFAKVWVARVPSSSNPSDAPSRGDMESLKFLGNIREEAVLCPLSKEPLMSNLLK